MLKLATLVVACAVILPAAGPPPAMRKPGRMEGMRRILTGNTRKAKMMRMALGFAATGTALALRPSAGTPFPARAAAQPVIITAGRTQFGCGGCVGPDWSAGRP